MLMGSVLTQTAVAGIIGNKQLGDMKSTAKHIVAGVVSNVTDTPSGSQWTIQSLRTYKGSFTASLTVKSRRLDTTERASVRSRRGLFLWIEMARCRETQGRA